MTTDIRDLSQAKRLVTQLTARVAELETKLSTQTAEPYGYVLKTGHGTAFRENLAGVEPDFVKHWVRVYTRPAKTEQPPQNCREVGPGKGLCDQCAAGHYERCRYVAAVQTEQPSLSDARILEAVHNACGTGLVKLTFINNKGIETPTDVATSFARALLSAQRQDSDKEHN